MDPLKKVKKNPQKSMILFTSLVKSYTLPPIIMEVNNGWAQIVLTFQIQPFSPSWLWEIKYTFLLRYCADSKNLASFSENDFDRVTSVQFEHVNHP